MTSPAVAYTGGNALKAATLPNVTTNVPRREVIVLSKEYVPLVVSGRKRTTVREGKRNYRLGDAQIKADDETIAIKIIGIKYKKFGELTDEDAKSDGFEKLGELQAALKKFYPTITETNVTTIVRFDVATGAPK